MFSEGGGQKTHNPCKVKPSKNVRIISGLKQVNESINFGGGGAGLIDDIFERSAVPCTQLGVGKHVWLCN